jgi:4-amino-4-deoxy-L-arabinose transferase-like glycosyltransferase
MKNFLKNIYLKLSGSRVTKYLKENQNSVVVLILILMALVLRIYQLSQIPGGFSEQERAVVGKLVGMNRENLWLGGQFYQAGYLYLAFLWTKIFGLTIYSLRFLSAVIGAATIYYCYAFISKWFSKKIAIFMTFLFAISSFHIAVSRLIIPDVLLPLLMLGLFDTLTLSYRTKNVWYFGISGMLLGLGFYTSPAFLIIPLLLLLAGGYFFYKNKKFVTAYRAEIMVALVAFVAISIPYWVSFAVSPMSYLTYFGFNRSLWQIALNVGQVLQMVFFHTPADYFINLGSEPLFDPFIFVTAMAGFFYALFRVERRKYFFLVFWFLSMMIYGALKRDVQIVNLIGILPIIYIFSSLVLDYVITRWFETFPYNKIARIVLVAIISIFFAMTALYNFDRYFVAYKNSPQVTKEFSATPPIPLK